MINQVDQSSYPQGSGWRQEGYDTVPKMMDWQDVSYRRTSSGLKISNGLISKLI